MFDNIHENCIGLISQELMVTVGTTKCTDQLQCYRIFSTDQLMQTIGSLKKCTPTMSHPAETSKWSTKWWPVLLAKSVKCVHNIVHCFDQVDEMTYVVVLRSRK